MWTEDNTQEQLIAGVLKHGPDILEHCQTSADLSNYLNRVHQERLPYPYPTTVDPTDWFIPKTHRDLDICAWVREQCPTDSSINARVEQELALFEKNGMIAVLKAMKYLVDTLRANNVVWGVGRGSSVASYVLYLIGVHKVDSIKYNLPIEEFFKGE